MVLFLSSIRTPVTRRGALLAYNNATSFASTPVATSNNISISFVSDMARFVQMSTLDVTVVCRNVNIISWQLYCMQLYNLTLATSTSKILKMMFICEDYLAPQRQ